MKKKIIIQTCICIFILGITFLGERTNNKNISKIYNSAIKMVMYEMTSDDFTRVGDKITSVFKEAPSTVVSVITNANNASKYGEPIDKKSDTNIKQVHAVSGGKVTKAGMNKKYGLYISIQHEDAVSTYGNLKDIKVLPAERVQRGEIIASFDTNCGKEFYFHLNEKM